MHFHQFQTEYFRVENGVLGIEVDGVLRRITPEDGEISVKAGSVHRFFIHPDSPESMTVYLSASDSGNDYQLDRVFFENWYGYWHDALLHDGGIDWIQFLAVCYAMLAFFFLERSDPYNKLEQIQDGGDAYTPAPAWVPFRRQVGYWTCVIIGRWIGGLLGYKPFFREYTTDWDYAVAKMKGSFFQRHLVHEAFEAEKSWKQQAELEPKIKPENAEFEKWTGDLSPTPLKLEPVAYENGEFKGGHQANGHTTGIEKKLGPLGNLTQRRVSS